MISVGSVVRVYPGPPFAFGKRCCLALTAASQLQAAGLRTARRTVGDGLVPCTEGLLILPDPWRFCFGVFAMVGALAQLGEHLLCKQGVIGSIPISSTNRERLDLFCPHGQRPADGARHLARRTIVLYGRIDRSVKYSTCGASPIVWRPHGAPLARECKDVLLKK